MITEFYKKDVEEQFGLKGEKRIVKDVLFFKLIRQSVRGTADVAYEYDQKATEEHKKNYPIAYQKYLKSLEPVVEVKEETKEEVKEKKKSPVRKKAKK